MQNNISKTINRIVTFSGIALLILFFLPSLNIKEFGGYAISFSFAEYGEAEAPLLYILVFLAFEIAISGSWLPKVTMFCAHSYIVIVVGFMIYGNTVLREELSGMVSISPSVYFFLQIIFSCVVIVALSWKKIEKKILKKIKALFEKINSAKA